MPQPVGSEVPLQTLNSLSHRIGPLIGLATKAVLALSGSYNGLSLDDRDPHVINQLLPLFDWVYQDYFQVQSDGWEHIPDGQVLLIGSHNGGLASPDTLMMTYDWFRHFGTERVVYGLMDPRMWQAMAPVARLAAQVGAIQAEPHITIKALDSGASVVIFPGGAKDVFRPYTQRHQIYFNGQQGFVKLALERKIPIVPLISYGAHSTLIVLAEIHDQLEAIAGGNFPWPLDFDPKVFPIYLGLPWGLAIGPLPNIPLPHPIHTRICPPIWFDHYGQEAAHDRNYVQACFRQVQDTMQAALDQLVAEEEPQ